MAAKKTAKKKAAKKKSARKKTARRKPASGPTGLQEEVSFPGSGQYPTRDGSRDAQNNPVTAGHRFSTEDSQGPEIPERGMNTTGPARTALDAPQASHVEVVQHLDPEHADRMAFMEQLVTIVVLESEDPFAEPHPAVWVNGVAQYFVRGMQQPVKRKYVAKLARSKVTTYTQRLVKDADGNDKYIQVPHTTNIYPFQVIEDPAGARGIEWLRRIQQEP